MASRMEGTRIVVFSRGFLWFMIALVIALIFYTASDNDTTGGARLVFSKIKEVGNLQNVMKNPFYHGLDKNNMPYSVSADEAIQQDSDTILLKNIKADMDTKSAKWLALHAGEGIFKMEAQHLTLTNGVDMFYDGGYEFRTERAFVDIGESTASGDVPVEGQGPMGTLTADRFSITERGQKIRFEGSVKMVIYR